MGGFNYNAAHTAKASPLQPPILFDGLRLVVRRTPEASGAQAIIEWIAPTVASPELSLFGCVCFLALCYWIVEKDEEQDFHAMTTPWKRSFGPTGLFDWAMPELKSWKAKLSIIACSFFMLMA